MQRSKKMVLLAHCLLNVNSKVDGLALYKGAHKQTICKYIEQDIGIIQLPCPEMTYLGINRWGMSKNQYDTPKYRKHCRGILIDIVEQLVDYKRKGYEIQEIVGIDGSPSCGVNYHSHGYTGGMVETAEKQKKLLTEKQGAGIFMEELTKLLRENDLQVKKIAIDEKETP
ncbi:MAG: DUF523 domain-containing protein [Clostridiaceae bacterium]|nr:DUF523 domain-containing protein [Clostridiaceae bacterium]